MDFSLRGLKEALEKKEISPKEIYEEIKKRIEERNPKIQAFLEIEWEKIEEEVKSSQKRWEKGNPLSPYDGIPIGIKDNIVEKGRKSFASSKILEGFISPYSATVIQKLKEKGFISIGRLNMDEFAMGSSTENSGYGICRNPYDLDRVPGGSSGGSAASVSSRMIPISLGSDTGGSIRQPASFCAVVGLKPTYGTVSRYGLIAFASSLDQIGPIGIYVEDVKTIYDIIKGYDPKDSTSIPPSGYKEVSIKDFSRIQVGIFPSLLEECSLEVQKSFEESLKIFQQMGISSFKEFSLKYQKYHIPVYYILASSEASSNLARFDGIRYGYRDPSAKSYREIFLFSRTHGFGKEVKRRILMGTFALSTGYYEAYYEKAQRLRSLIQKEFLEILKEVDILLLPTTPTPPFKIGEKIKDPISMYLSDLLTVGASLAGIPAISIPSPFKDLPLGIQIIGNFFSEDLLFHVASSFQKHFLPSPPSL